IFYDSQERERTIFVENVDKKDSRLNSVFIRGERGGVIHIISAQTGMQKFDVASGRRSLILSDVHVYALGPRGAPDEGIGRFKQMTLHLRDANPISIEYKRKAAPTINLARSNLPPDIAEYQWRLSTPVSTVLLGILAVILSRAAPRSSRYTKTIVALLIYAVYYNLTAMAKTWVETDVVGKFPGIWWVQFGLVVLIAVLLLIPKLAFNRAATRGLTTAGETNAPLG
ncbi:MAG: LptF/LptG family permease, partial [Gammaproteobacteria bacterium]